jgi:hypothetical protein
MAIHQQHIVRLVQQMGHGLRGVVDHTHLHRPTKQLLAGQAIGGWRWIWLNGKNAVNHRMIVPQKAE